MPSKKVFDIIPPKEQKEAPLSASTLRQHFTLNKPINKPAWPQKKICWWPVLTVVILIGCAGAAYFLIKPKAEISVWPRKTPLVVEAQIVVGNDIAGEFKSEECSFSQEFAATGVKTLSTKASGTIRVYNAYATTPQTLIANTRFVSDGGKLFKIPEKIVIPGARYEGTKLIPGEVDAFVQAGEAGEEYNIGPSTFSLPALAGTSRYTAFYARSFSSMTGGSKKQANQVTEKDLSSAKDSLSLTALDNCRKTLQDSLSPQDYVVNEEAFKSEILKYDPLVSEGQEADKFTFNIKTKAAAFVFKKSDLEDFVKTYLTSRVPEGKQSDTDSLIFSYSFKDINLASGKILLNIDISAEIYSAVDENGIKEAAKSQLPEELSDAFGQFSEIEDFQVRLWPFWVNKIPAETESITIQLKLD